MAHLANDAVSWLVQSIVVSEHMDRLFESDAVFPDIAPVLDVVPFELSFQFSHASPPPRLRRM